MLVNIAVMGNLATFIPQIVTIRHLQQTLERLNLLVASVGIRTAENRNGGELILNLKMEKLFRPNFLTVWWKYEHATQARNAQDA